MPRQARQHAATGIHHVMVRGVNRDAIFLEDADRDQFLLCLGRAKEAAGCQVLAFCLMSNHAHLLIRASGEPIGAAMKRLGVRYVGWFNNKYGRVGHLFQDRFRSVPVDDDSYLLTVVRYIWNNPVEAGLVDEPTRYRWNSCWSVSPRLDLVDVAQLDALLPLHARLTLAAPLADRPSDGTRPGRGPRHTLAQATELLIRVSGLRDPASFRDLDAAHSTASSES